MSASSAPRRSRRWPTSQELGLAGFASLIVLAVVFYLSWGLFFGVWVDNGVYAVTITLLLFGVSGMWLFWPEPPSASPPAA